jgi:hypothetical protein
MRKPTLWVPGERAMALEKQSPPRCGGDCFCTFFAHQATENATGLLGDSAVNPKFKEFYIPSQLYRITSLVSNGRICLWAMRFR